MTHPGDPGSVTSHRRAAIGYYRTLARPWSMPAHYRRWHSALTDRAITPTLYLHGTVDGCLGSEFVQLEQPEVVDDLVRRFLASQLR